VVNRASPVCHRRSEIELADGTLWNERIVEQCRARQARTLDGDDLPAFTSPISELITKNPLGLYVDTFAWLMNGN